MKMLTFNQVTNFSPKVSPIRCQLFIKGLLLFVLFLSMQGLRAQISYVHSTTNSSEASASLAINKPVGLAVGDLMIANITNRTTASDPTTIPSGWERVTSYALITAGRWAYVAYKVADANDLAATSFTFGWGTTSQANIAGGISAFRGVNTTVNGGIKIGTAAVAPASPYTDNISPSGITTDTDNSMVLFLGQISGNGITFTGNWTLGGANMEEAYFVNSTGDPRAGLAYYTKTTAGSTGAGSKAISTAARWGGVLLALKPSETSVPVALNAFRSNVSSGSWNNSSSWQQKFDDGEWYNAATYPSSSYGSLISTTSGYPVLESVDSSDQIKNAAKTHNINLPIGTSVGDLILILWADHAGSGTANVKPAYSGWTKLDFGKFHTSHNAFGFYKVITSPIESQIEIQSDDDDESGHIIYRFEAGTFEGAPFFSTTYVAGTINDTKFPNPPNLASSPLAVQKVTWIAAGFSHPKSLVKIPTGFTNAARKQAVSANGMVVAAMLNKEDDELDPGEFEISAAEEWVAATIGIKGKALTTYSTEKSIATVRDGHTIAITDNATADTVNVESGGLLKFDLPNSSGKSTLSLDISSGSPMTVTGTLEAADLTYVSGAGSFTLASGGTFKVGSEYGLTTGVGTTSTAGNVRVTGARSFHSAANYYFDHNGNQATGNAVITANNVYIEGGGVKTLTPSTLTINGTLTLTSGYLSTSTSTLVIINNGGSAGGGSDASYVQGPIRKIGTNGAINYEFIYPVGLKPASGSTNRTYSPVKIKYRTVSSDDITFTVRHFHGSPATLTPKIDRVLQRMTTKVFEQEYWDVHNDDVGSSLSPSSNNVLQDYGVDVTLYFANPGGDSKNKTRYYLTHAKATTDSTYWEIPNMSTQVSEKDITVFEKRMLCVSVLDQRSFSGMGAMGTDEITPVTLTNFNARLTPENKVALSWATASESVNKGFRIERQHEFGSTKFQDIGFVPSKADGGNSAQLLYYNFTDIAPKANATSYYRLVQEDIDGKLTNSEVRMIRLNGQSVSLVYPNPSKGNFLISRTADGKKMDLQVTDQSGKIIRQVNGIESATHKLFISQPGIYNIKLTYPETGKHSIQRVVVH